MLRKGVKILMKSIMSLIPTLRVVISFVIIYFYPIDSEKYEQYSEISDIQWLTIGECRAKIRPYNISKHGIITSCENFINNYQSEFTLKE